MNYIIRSHSFFKGPDDNPNVFALMNILTTFALTHPQISYCQGKFSSLLNLKKVERHNNEFVARHCLVLVIYFFGEKKKEVHFLSQ